MIRAISRKIKNLLGGNSRPANPSISQSSNLSSQTAPSETAGNRKTKPPTQKKVEPSARKPKQEIKNLPGDKRSRYHSTVDKKQKPPVFDQKPKHLPPRPNDLIISPEKTGETRFTDLPIHRNILFGLQSMKFEYCTPIQAKSLPFLLAGRDLAGKAQTGTGKTAAFLVAAFTKLLNNPKPHRIKGTCRVLVLAPTRELAIQIFEDAERVSVFAGMNNLVVFGGMDHRKQREMLEKPVDILIGTPGRLIDYARSRHLNLSQTEMLVIDEADRMLDMGFIPDVRRIVAQLPKQEKRQTLLFSATLEPRVLRLADAWQNDPVAVESEAEQLITGLIDQQYYTVAIYEKFAFLLWLINHEPFERMLIFGNRKDRNFRLSQDLKTCGVKCALLSGDIPQDKRLKILERFRAGTEKIVIATDVAARGIHVDDVSIVVNYDLPEQAEDYVHRIGRTGRAGKTGQSISLVCEYGAYSLEAIEKLTDDKIQCIYPDEEKVTLPEDIVALLKTANKSSARPSYRPGNSSNRKPSSQSRSRSGPPKRTHSRTRK